MNLSLRRRTRRFKQRGRTQWLSGELAGVAVWQTNRGDHKNLSDDPGTPAIVEDKLLEALKREHA